MATHFTQVTAVMNDLISEVSTRATMIGLVFHCGTAPRIDPNEMGIACGQV